MDLDVKMHLDNFPFKGPSNIKFTQKIYHQNVMNTGEICCNAIGLIGSDRWIPTKTLAKVM
jgi:ubiquitin-protein ligase